MKPFKIFFDGSGARINADPVFIMYAHGVWVGWVGSGGIHVSYFVRSGEGKFKLTNESIGAPFDDIFKSKKFLDAAKGEKPFEDWKIK